MIPSAAELDAWVAALKTGHAVPEMMPRFIDGYRRLLRVAEAAEGAHRSRPHAHRQLDEALDALEAPMPDESK